MRSVTIVMALASAWLIIFGALILKGKAMDKAIDKRKEEIKDLKNYMKFNGIFYNRVFYGWQQYDNYNIYSDYDWIRIYSRTYGKEI